jgi:DNA-binding response OmpR family regulator
MAGDPKKVLVVDDEPDTLTFITTVLEDNGYVTRQASNGEDAVKMIEEEAPDLITLDITMPERSGVSVYRLVKEGDRFKGIPVIIITGVSDDFRRFISTRRQVPPPDGYISKPIDHEELLGKVRELLS